MTPTRTKRTKKTSRSNKANTTGKTKEKDPLSLREPVSAKAVAWHHRIAIIVVVLTAILLSCVVLGPHKIGDYYTETDFYGSYAEGARLIQAGHLDPSRYGVAGPVFELVLAGIGFITRNLFAAAELIAILAACGTLILWFLLLARLAGSGLALWATLFLAVNPTFFRYGYSVTTDALGTFVQTAALFAIFLGRRGLGPLWAGALAALAALTRYSAVYLFPGAILYYACFNRHGLNHPSGSHSSGGSDSLSRSSSHDRRNSRRRALALFVVGFGIVILPWVGFSIHSGQMPGGALFHDIAFDIYSSRGTSWEQYAVQVQPEVRSLRDVVFHAPAVVVRREFSNLVQHLVRDFRLLLGWPVALWCAFGLILALWDGTWRRLLPVWMMGALLFITLVPAIHSARYSLSLAPVYLTLAGAAAASPRLIPAIKGKLFPLKWILAFLPLFVSASTSVNTQREVMRTLPREVLEAAKVIERATPQATAQWKARVLARKPHIAYAAGATLVTFPAAGSLQELAQYCLREKVDFIYFSRVEANARAYFTYLLDPESQVPGLRLEGFFPGGPAVLYRVEPGFGTLPSWFASDSLRTVHVTRAIASMGSAPWTVQYICGIYACDQGQYAAALEHLNLLVQLRPRFEEGYFYAGDAYVGLGQLENAVAAYSRALELRPDYREARLHLGRAQLSAGQPRVAAQTWRPIIGAVRDSSTLVTMIELYQRLGDGEAAFKARETLRNKVSHKSDSVGAE